MSTQTRVVRLLQNTLYPTYQLHATMSNKQTTPAEGLRFAALTVMEWLRQRIGEDIPQELVQPEPERYKEADDSCLPSLPSIEVTLWTSYPCPVRGCGACKLPNRI